MVLADRMGCLKGGVVANVVVPTPAYVRLATHYGFRPDFCEGGDPESKGIVEHLVGYAKGDLLVAQAPFTDLAAANDAAQGGARRSTASDTARSLRCRPNGWPPNKHCSAHGRRCGCAWAR